MTESVTGEAVEGAGVAFETDIIGEEADRALGVAHVVNVKVVVGDAGEAEG